MHSRSTGRCALALACLAAAVAAPSFASSLIVDWNEEALSAVRANAPRPTVVSRTLFLLSAAKYDAWAAYGVQALPYTPANRLLRRPSGEHNDNNRSIAISHAAYRILLHFYPQHQTDFAARMSSLGVELSESTDASTPAGLGNTVAANLLAARAGDGSNEANNFADHGNYMFPTLYAAVNSADDAAPNAPGGAAFNADHWQPLRVPTGSALDDEGLPRVDPQDPASYRDQQFLTPHWGQVRPFALGNPRDLLPPPPPQYGSEESYTDALGHTTTNHQAWLDQYEEVRMISALLDDRDKVIAEFWADGPRSETPPGHWNQLAQGISQREGNDIGADARLFMALNSALFDAGIASWYTKRTYDNARPQSGIRHMHHGEMIEAWAGPGLGTQLIPGESWRPYQELTFVTPPFPEFTSGHSAFSAAAAEVLTGLTGSEQFFDGVTRIDKDLDGDGENDLLGEFNAQPGSLNFDQAPAETVTLRWNTFKDAADEAGVSRLYGGIHIQDGDLRGRELGAAVGLKALAKARALFAGRLAPSVGQAGAYYDPERSGEGFHLNFTSDGRAMLSWYTYDLEREQMWLYGVAAPQADGSLTIPLSVTQGALFGNQFVPSDVSEQPWGEVQIDFVGCGLANLRYTASAGGFGSGEIALSRLGVTADSDCEAL